MKGVITAVLFTALVVSVRGRFQQRRSRRRGRSWSQAQYQRDGSMMRARGGWSLHVVNGSMRTIFGNAYPASPARS